jgi:hypothetical protein
MWGNPEQILGELLRISLLGQTGFEAKSLKRSKPQDYKLGSFQLGHFRIVFVLINVVDKFGHREITTNHWREIKVIGTIRPPSRLGIIGK